jgi:predicted regulator of Ras-like GTPase activity (Roadblock/LC7/MglB family)
LSFSEDERLLRKILRAIINSTAGLKYALIIDDTGITIMNQAKFVSSDDEVSVEKIGAIAGAVFTAGEEQGQILGYGGISIQITEYASGLIFSAKAGKGVLCIAADLNVQIGFVRAVLKNWAPKVTKILERYLDADQEGINKELKELFNSDTIGFMQ